LGLQGGREGTVRQKALQRLTLRRRPVPAWVADALADAIEAQANRGIALVTDLRDLAEKARRRPKHWVKGLAVAQKNQRRA
jgi:hypothetical protein